MITYPGGEGKRDFPEVYPRSPDFPLQINIKSKLKALEYHANYYSIERIEIPNFNNIFSDKQLGVFEPLKKLLNRGGYYIKKKYFKLRSQHVHPQPMTDEEIQTAINKFVDLGLATIETPYDKARDDEYFLLTA